MNNEKPLPLSGLDSDTSPKAIYSLPPKEIYPILKTCEYGLTADDAQLRLKQYGPNKLAEAKKKSPLIKLLKNFTHLMAILLWFGGFVGIVAKMPQLAIAIWMVNVINGLFSFWQEFRAEKATEALKKMLPTFARVLRDGTEQKIMAEDLVPGDVILLAEGEHISADCRLVEQAVMRTNQSTLTGESRPVSKSADAVLQDGITYTEVPNMVFAGTSVATGNGKAVVVTTGMSTEFGKIAHLTQEMTEELSPLQIEMKNATKIVTIIAVGVGVVFFVISMLFAGITLAESFIFSMGMIVAFVPEGMLPTVTLALAMGTQRMAKRHALIKKLSAVETLGCTTVICTDKTGTLTQNEMTVRNLWVPTGLQKLNLPTDIGRILTVTGTGYEPAGEILSEDKEAVTSENAELSLLVTAANLCNNSRLVPPENGNSGRWQILGDPTEGCLRVLMNKANLDNREIEARYPRIHEIPFDSQRKRMATIHLPAKHQSSAYKKGALSKNRVAFIKGAPNEVLDLCESVLSGGTEINLSQKTRDEVMRVNDQFARDGLRVLAIAQRKLPESIGEYTPDSVEEDMVFLGLIAMMDPPRPEVAEAVAKCNTAGIRIIMITGDYGLTAESIARRVGIVHSSNPRIITGFELNNLDDGQLVEALKDEIIFARVAPENKLRVVTALQELGNIVAVTGDGVNDAPALKKANIGVAMGMTGSDVAKEAASMILTDDNFASIVNAIEEGRAVYANIKKFCTYIFTSNAPEAVPFMLYAFTAGRIPLALNVMHVLSIDLGTDMVPALALGAEPPEPGMMTRPPRSLSQHVIDSAMLRRAYIILGSVHGLLTMVAFYYFYWTKGYWGQWIDLPGSGDMYRSATGIALAAVVMMQIGNLFAQRSERVSVFKIPLFNNRMLWIGILTEIIIILMFVYLPVFNKFIGTGPFEAKYWLILVCMIPALTITDEIRKLVLRNRKKSA
ncbi:MAG: cation-transporting P-type ATPase [Pelolinea sp.]|nr:cation-transporting P-type ATPase [Pelolinea sp.]